MISHERFLRRFRRLIILTWTLPPIVGLSFLLFIEMFTPEQMAIILTTPSEPLFILGGLLFSVWYFDRFARPLVRYLRNPTTLAAEAALKQIRRFPFHFWGFFLGYILVAPATVILSAEQFAGFSGQAVDWFRIHLVALIVSIIVGLPLFFLLFDLFGQTLGQIRNTRPVLTVKTRVFLIGSLVPLLMDTMLVQYYWTRTGYFTYETFTIWLALEVLAIAGSLLFVRSFGQALMPLENFIRDFHGNADNEILKPVSRSTDELGALTQELGMLLGEQYLHREILAVSNRLLRDAGSSHNQEQLLNSVIQIGATTMLDDIFFLLLYDNNTNELVGVIDSHNPYNAEGYYRLSMDENSLAVHVFKQCRPIAVDNTIGDLRVSPRMVKRFHIRAALAVPLLVAKEPIGVLISARQKRPHHYTEREIKLLNAFAQEAALVVHTSSLEAKRLKAEKRYQRLLELAPDAILLLDKAGAIIEANQATANLFSTPVHALPGRLLNDFFSTVYNGKNQLQRLIQLQEGESDQFEICLEHDGIPSTIAYIHAACLLLDEQQVIQIIIQDISQRKHIEGAITHIVEGISTAIGERFFEAIATQLAQILDANVVMLGIVDELQPDKVKTLAFYRNGKILDNMDYDLEGTPCQRVIGDKPHSYTSNVQALFPKSKPLKQMKVEAYSGVPLFKAHGNPLGLIAAMYNNPLNNPEFAESVMQIFAARTAAEIERTQSELHIKHLAYFDTLTDLPNRELLLDRLHQSMAQAARSQHHVAIVLLDLDQFKDVNDTMGHPIGDKLLSEVAQRLRDCVREGDTVARLGGDEFVILLPDLYSRESAVKDASTVAEKIREALSHSYSIEQHELLISTSMGIAFYPSDGENAEELIKHADTAMYQAKSNGRDNYQFFSPAMNAAAVERLELEAALRQALSLAQLELVYQPKFDIIHNHIVGAEALLRWDHPELGPVTPKRFIPVSEDTGQIISIGRWVLETACQAAVQFCQEKKQGRDIQSLSINVSPRQFRHPDFVSQVRDVMHNTGVDPQCIELEMTENLLIHDFDDVRQKLNQLKEMGVRLSIDDFGTGYSSLRYLQQLPIDILKIDHSFINNINSDPGNAAIVEAIIAMASRLGLQVVAEGVENKSQLAHLRVQGCTICQGYYFSRPLSKDAFLHRLTNN